MIDAFRLINPNMMVLGQEPRQTTSVLGHLQKPSIQGTFLKRKDVFESANTNFVFQPSFMASTDTTTLLPSTTAKTNWNKEC